MVEDHDKDIGKEASSETRFRSEMQYKNHLKPLCFVSATLSNLGKCNGTGDGVGWKFLIAFQFLRYLNGILDC